MSTRRIAWSVVVSLAGWASAQAVPVAQREFDLVLKRTPDVTAGAKLYETCAACHGVQGQGVGEGSVPAIGGQHFTVIAKQLVDFRAGLRGEPRMAHFSDTQHLAYSQSVADVAAYISTLPARVGPGKNGGDAAAVRLYARSCERCHGVEGEGNADSLAPRIGGQYSGYLARQLDDAVSGRRPAMKATHNAQLADLSPKELAAVLKFVSEAAPPPGRTAAEGL